VATLELTAGRAIARRLQELCGSSVRRAMAVLRCGRLTGLAQRAQMTASSMLDLVDALDRRGSVERIPDQTDRRAKLIRLTDHGWAVCTSGFHAIVDMQASWAAQLGGDKFTRFLSLLRELIDALDLQR
jgi:DNA-binding MarR family transcriptional regulator